MTPPLNRLIHLFHRRWSVPVLVMLEREHGAKFVTLANRLGVGRETLRDTLDDLIAMGLVQRNPGYGHPMRPEYLLTPEGARLCPSSGRLLSTVRRLDLEPLAFKKWTLPITYAIGGGERRFNELRDTLPGITPRALTLSLKDLEREHCVRRTVYDAYPPITCYDLRPRGRSVLAVLRPLARAV